MRDCERRIRRHPVFTDEPSSATVPFTFDGQPCLARVGEVITSALQAAGIRRLGHHPKDGGAQGLFCANGQCSQCLVVADGRPVKACMTEVTPGMQVGSLAAADPALPAADDLPSLAPPGEVRPEVLIIGGGPAGIAAALELGQAGVATLLVEDKAELGGKLTLQTHPFFGSVKDCHAGTRGTTIGRLLETELAAQPGVEIWRNASAVGVFADGRIGVVQQGHYRLVRPALLLVAAGAREKALVFPGCDLPGVYGAGAFQTLVNRDRVRAAERLFVIGGGNVGLIGAYHALQAGIRVVGLVEAAARCGGYRVHEDKLRRLGVPIWTGHTVLAAHGHEAVEAVTVAALDERFVPRPGSERRYAIDTLLLAVGLDPVDELTRQARQHGIPVLAAGDSEQIAEASAALFSGRLAGRRAARQLGREVEVPADWAELVEVMKSRPGPDQPSPELAPGDAAVLPVIRCHQSIPCDPCVEACAAGLIRKPGGILDLPVYSSGCTGCAQCLIRCPGLAIVLLRQDHDPQRRTAKVIVPWEFLEETLPADGVVQTVGDGGEPVGQGKILAVRRQGARDRRRLVELEVPWGERLAVAGFALQQPEAAEPVAPSAAPAEADPLVCRCERVRQSALVAAIRDGVRDMNQLKAVSRAGMGGCGGKTCRAHVLRLFQEQGVPAAEVTLPSLRPLVAEVSLAVFAGVGRDSGAATGEGGGTAGGGGASGGGGGR